MPARSPRWVDGCPRPYWYGEAGRITLVLPGVESAAGYDHLADPCDALCLNLPPGADIEAARASLERSLPRRGWTAAGALRVAVDPAAGYELALPYRPALDLGDPEPFVRAFERSFCAPGRAAAPAYFAPRGALALAGGPHPRPLDTPLARLPEQAVARFWRLRLDGDGVLTADWEGSGWTAGRNRGTSTWTFGGDGRIERLDPALRPGRAAHGGRMTEPWVAALRAALGDRVHTQAAELAAVARDSSHVIGRPEALIYPETSEHVATARAHRP